MSMSDDLAKWATAFLQQYHSEGGAEAAPPSAPRYPGITPEAARLLESVDAGGVPAFMTQALLRIATDNGIAITRETTPNAVIAALRELAAKPVPRNDQ